MADVNISEAASRIAETTKLNATSIEKAIELLEEGNTLPFIARYRKEVTKGLDEIQLRQVEDLWLAEKEIASRKATILKTIDQQGNLTPQLEKEIQNCFDKQKLEDLYLPFKPKRRTRATAAKEKGLEPLAQLLFQQKPLNRSKRDVLSEFVDQEKGVADEDEALQGALDIVAEWWSEDATTRQWLAKEGQYGRVTSKVKRGKKEEGAKFESYFDFSEPLSRIPSHRFLAMKRGEAEGLLNLGIEFDEDRVVPELQRRLLTRNDFEFYHALKSCVVDCYERLLAPATETTLLQTLKEKSDEDASRVFASNLRELLLAPPAGPRVTLGMDPGFRTGCKLAVVSETGRFLETATIFPTPPKNDHAGAERKLLELIEKHGVEMIAIGNGTASRETDQFVADTIKKHKLNVTKVMVNESGASIYSASELAAKEYPHLDLTVRGAISIAHRLQDPLAELVKIDPKSIGVGQYQHDVNQSLLKRTLDREVESCVNSVGVDLNLASASLLSHVAGIGPKLASEIVNYRDSEGEFKSRATLTKVPKLGKKAFQQAAGFLRVRNAKQPLDASAVHPESYSVVEKMAKSIGCSTQELVGDASLVDRLKPNDFVSPEVGLPTITDILAELKKPGRDPRKQFKAVEFDENVHEIDDLIPEMILEGVVTNVTRFGAFVDIGVHQDGLVHISEMADRYINDPSEVVSLGDVVRVKVLEVDANRKRISLSIKQA